MKIEIWSDVVCPWCYIGKRRFERALAQFGNAADVDVVYRSFELDPATPATHDGTHAEVLAGKFGIAVEKAEQLNGQMAERAAAEGLEFRFDIMRSGNTFDAHRLLHLARERGLQLEMKERLMRAAFTEGLPIADHATLIRLAVEVGIPESDVSGLLESDAYSSDVRADEKQAQAYGISGVPFYVVDGKFGVSGAQPTEAFVQVLEQAYAESVPKAVVASGGACEGDVCAAE